MKSQEKKLSRFGTMVLMDLGSNHNIEQINAGAQFLPRCLNLAPLVKKYNKKYLLKWLQPKNLNVCTSQVDKTKNGCI